jgi:hypothetical protein
MIIFEWPKLTNSFVFTLSNMVKSGIYLIIKGFVILVCLVLEI